MLDADIYGPNVPRMLGVTSVPPPEEQRLVPAMGWGVRVMSLALIAQHDQAVVWRGPMIGKLLAQFLDQVAWDALDYLIVDLPPGTGDAPPRDAKGCTARSGFKGRAKETAHDTLRCLGA